MLRIAGMLHERSAVVVVVVYVMSFRVLTFVRLHHVHAGLSRWIQLQEMK